MGSNTSVRLALSRLSSFSTAFAPGILPAVIRVAVIVLCALPIFSCVCQGTILLAVNPLKAVPSPDIESFMDKPIDPEIPHPYAIAEVRNIPLGFGKLRYLYLKGIFCRNLFEA